MSWVLLALLGAIFAALVAIFGKIGLEGLDSTVATTVRAIIMAVFLVAVSLGLGKLSLESLPTGKPLLFITLSAVAGALSWLFMFSALKIGPAPGVSALDRTSVVFVLIFSLLFLGTQFSWKALLGALLIAAGAVLMI
ncbi:EamA family transporter [Patescibacteria group bacterium]|nr:EamA family transporter [Patescibacteria group bacterium]MBU2158894.1 EamA family transporter [Patescibacteria group bacterium]